METARGKLMIGNSRSSEGSRAARHAPGAAGPPWDRRSLLLIAVAASAGCATAPRPVPVAVELERTVLNLRGKNAGYVRRLEELENRIFVLEDQLDSRKLAAEQGAPATLPARALRADGLAAPTTPAVPAPPAGPPPGPIDDGARTADAAVETTIVAEHPVDYSGEAAEAGAVPLTLGMPASPRPMLRLSKKRRIPIEQGPLSSRAPEPLAEFRLAMSARPTSDALGAYRSALETLRGGDPDAARVAFREFLDADPLHDYADNAQYWIGECYYTQRQFRAAERAFRKVVERYPRGNKVPDAMLKLGFTLQLLGDDTGGRAVLESLLRAFPKHDAARLAAGRLARPEPAPLRSRETPTLGTILPAPFAHPAAGSVAP